MSNEQDSMDKKCIVWFRQDLRLKDNPALYAAHKVGTIIPIYIHDEEDFAGGQSSRWWLHHSLQSLSKDLGGALQIYTGDSLKILQNIIKKTGAQGVYWNICYEPLALKRDDHIKKILLKQGLTVEISNGSLLWQPDQVLKKDGTPYKVFTAFFKNGCLKAASPREILPKPQSIKLIQKNHGTSIQDLGLLKSNRFVDQLDTYWIPGEQAAIKRLKEFIKHDLWGYKLGRDFPAKSSISKLSAYLHFGEISPQQIWWTIKELGYEYGSRVDVQHFLQELGWREFSYHVLFYNPDMPRKNLHKKFDSFEWRYDQKDLDAWKQGLTGYPLVDAGMRELYSTGFMHNRVRMVTASFLIKNLRIHWHEGQDWFWNLLVDADLASNSFNWQWVAGCGYDAAPYFRIFNPITQGKKFDVHGAYIRHWIPELSALPDKYLFDPSSAPDHVLQKAGIVLGKTYPRAIVDLATSRKYALAAFKKLK